MHTLLCDETLAPCGQADHHHAYPRIFYLDTDTISFYIGAVPGPRRRSHKVALWRLVHFRLVLVRFFLWAVRNQ